MNTKKSFTNGRKSDFPISKIDGFLLASMPSSGSDWLAKCICKANPSFVYAREYFSPICNPEIAERLSLCVGDTMASTYQKLTKTSDIQSIYALLDDTWRKSGFTFTKENYLAFQIYPFAEFFDIVILLRKFSDTFPPNRHRVMVWYEHFYASISDDSVLKTVSVNSPMDRAAIGHYAFASKMLASAKAGSIPVCFYHTISDDASKLPGENIQEIVERSLVTADRPSSHWFKLWRNAIRLYDSLETRFGQIVAF